MVKATHVDLSYATGLSGICPTVEMGNNYHREATLLLLLVVFMLSKASLLRNIVAESGRVLGRPMDSMASGSGVPCACRLKSGNRSSMELPFREAQKGVG